MRHAIISLLFALGVTGMASIAQADCSHADYQNKYARIQSLIAQLDREDPPKSAALAQQVADIEAQNQGGIYDLGHTCGAYDDILMKAGH
jgi:hypothetical protein